MSRSELLRTLATLLTRRGATVATAESCTGGNIVATLTSVPGASEWLHTGLICYQRASKQRVLGLSEAELSDGLVSEKTAKAMAEHARQVAGVTYAVSTTGVCGPAESEGIPPAAAWVGVATPAGCTAEWVTLPDRGREANQAAITMRALEILLEHLQKEGTPTA